MNRSRLPELPGAMRARAEWARKTACQNPSLVEIDHEFLPWVYCEEDGYWYSFDGNYSSLSTEIRIKNAQEWEDKKANMEENYKRNYIEGIIFGSKIRQDILERDDYTCQLCGKNGKSKLHVHHILKKREGGTDYYDSLLTVCPTCHSKADRELYNPDWESNG